MLLLLPRPHRTTTQATLCYYYCPGHTVLLLLARPHYAHGRAHHGDPEAARHGEAYPEERSVTEADDQREV
jgi:hypothetical protein